MQTLVMFTMMLLGFVLVKRRVLTGSGIQQLSTLLLTVIMPALMIDSCQLTFDRERLLGFFFALLLALLSHLVHIAIATPLYYRNHPTSDQGMSAFCCIYSNAGFMGFPLIQASLGEEALFYAAAYMVMFTIFSWTHGVMVIRCQKKLGGFRELLQLVKNPGIIGVAVGLLLFFCRILLPAPIGPALHYVASMNTPVAMLICGALIANSDFRRLLQDRHIYLVSFVKLIAAPLACILLYKLLRLDTLLPNASYLIMVSMIAAACPTAVSASVLPSRYGLKGEYGSQIVSVSTLLSILTLPLMVLVTGWVFP